MSNICGCVIISHVDNTYTNISKLNLKLAFGQQKAAERNTEKVSCATKSCYRSK